MSSCFTRVADIPSRHRSKTQVRQLLHLTPASVVITYMQSANRLFSCRRLGYLWNDFPPAPLLLEVFRKRLKTRIHCLYSTCSKISTIVRMKSWGRQAKQGRRHGFKGGGDNFASGASEKFFLTPHLTTTWGVQK